MNRSHLQVRVLMSSLVSALLCTQPICTQPIASQVIPDNTLPAGERSQVTDNPNSQIDGGARRGDNLFHSFRSFSVPMGGFAYFNLVANTFNPSRQNSLYAPSVCPSRS